MTDVPEKIASLISRLCYAVRKNQPGREGKSVVRTRKYPTILINRIFPVILGILLLTACAGTGPGITEEDKFRVFTPLFADNRVYYVGEPTDNVSNLILQGDRIDSSVARSNVIIHGQPLSIVMNSVEMPQQWPDGITSKTIDVAVILDLATAVDGSDQSIVVWYQRGVVPGQSLNFSNLLVYFEPRWDKRVAPLFRVRVLNVTDERNAEALASLERIGRSGAAIANLVASPVASPLFSIATQAAKLTLLGNQNTLLLDYTVQFFSSDYVDQTTGAGLGALRRGSFVVLGRPNSTDRNFWGDDFKLERRSRIVSGAAYGEAHIPIVRVTVGTFESIVPKIVIERSNALTQLLREQSAKVSLTVLQQQADALQISIKAFTAGEKIRRFGVSDIGQAIEALRILEDENVTEEDRFFLIRAFNEHFMPASPFTSVDQISGYLDICGMRRKAKIVDGNCDPQ